MQSNFFEKLKKRNITTKLQIKKNKNKTKKKLKSIDNKSLKYKKTKRDFKAKQKNK